MRLSVVIPAYNEEENIAQCVFDVSESYPDAEIIVVNDASTDNTRTILEQGNYSNLKLFNNEKNMGHGYSVVRGLREAQGDYVLYIDADRQIDIENLAGIKPQYDVVSGWRYNRHDKLFRKIISFCLKSTILFRHRLYIKDANCPFKLYKREALQLLLAEVPDTYIVPIACIDVLARKHGLKTLTIPTYHAPYQGIRKGFLQAIDFKLIKFLYKAFWEIVKL